MLDWYSLAFLKFNSQDGYFFLRYLRMMMMIFVVGCCVTFPVLFPVNGITLAKAD